MNDWEKEYKSVKEKIEEIELKIMKIELELTYNEAILKRLKVKQLEILKRYRY